MKIQLENISFVISMDFVGAFQEFIHSHCLTAHLFIFVFKLSHLQIGCLSFTFFPTVGFIGSDLIFQFFPCVLDGKLVLPFHLYFDLLDFFFQFSIFQSLCEQLGCHHFVLCFYFLQFAFQIYQILCQCCIHVQLAIHC